MLAFARRNSFRCSRLRRSFRSTLAYAVSNISHSFHNVPTTGIKENKMSGVRWLSSSTQEAPLFKKVLIANRGEITCRVIETCRRMGIPTVAVYSKIDANAKHVQMADEAVYIGEAPSSESYLVIDNILRAIDETGADAVHPGYGFLSENKLFAAALEAKGVEFLGPNEFAIHSMGDKIESMRIAEQAGVSCAKRFDGEVNTTEHAQELAKGIGYPIIMKASAGGGGKGMRIAWTEQELIEGFEICRTEAAASFGDSRMLIQQFVCPYESRHIEIQIIGDKHGNYAAFPERECSIQRRNQKIIEESPSVLLTPETRLKMQEQAVLLCKSVGYHSAGTVEFVADNDQNFYFLEMNTRLQVEHPVTEEVTGVDLVELMIRVAAGEQLPEHLRNKQVPYKGWAVESRIYAEDPFQNFLPSTGTMMRYEEPTTEKVLAASSHSPDEIADSRVRVDSGVREGSAITMYYDPMISKLVTYGASRDIAVDLMGSALDTYVVRGLQNNIPFCRALCSHPTFLSGNISTDFIKNEYPEGFTVPEFSGDDTQNFLGALLSVYMARLVQRVCHNERLDLDEFFGRYSNLVVKLSNEEVYRIQVQGVRHPFLEDDIGELNVDLDYPEIMIGFSFGLVGNAEGDVSPQAVSELDMTASTAISATSNFESCNITFSCSTGEKDHVYQLVDLADDYTGNMSLMYKGCSYSAQVFTDQEYALNAHFPEVEQEDLSRIISSPMPGRIVSVNVAIGDEIAVGTEVLVVEAMKMQNSLKATGAGVVKEILIIEGDTVSTGDVLVRLE